MIHILAVNFKGFQYDVAYFSDCAYSKFFTKGILDSTELEKISNQIKQIPISTLKTSEKKGILEIIEQLQNHISSGAQILYSTRENDQED